MLAAFPEMLTGSAGAADREIHELHGTVILCPCGTITASGKAASFCTGLDKPAATVSAAPTNPMTRLLVQKRCPMPFTSPFLSPY
jgi:hypothetical protein